MTALAAAVAAFTAGEQLYLARPRPRRALAAALLLAYALCVLGLSGSARAAVLFLLVAAAARAGAEWLRRLRGANLWTGLAVVVAPYLGLWLAWAYGAPGPGPALALRPLLSPLALGAPSPALAERALILCSAYLFCWGSATFLTRATLAGFLPQVAGPAEHPAAGAAARADPARGLGRAGRLIGDLERTLVLSLALSGNVTAIGFVIAAKSIARWDLARTHAEYFLVGTLTSIGIALLAGEAARRALGAP